MRIEKDDFQLRTCILKLMPSCEYFSWVVDIRMGTSLQASLIWTVLLSSELQWTSQSQCLLVVVNWVSELIIILSKMRSNSGKPTKAYHLLWWHALLAPHPVSAETRLLARTQRTLSEARHFQRARQFLRTKGFHFIFNNPKKTHLLGGNDFPATLGIIFNSNAKQPNLKLKLKANLSIDPTLSSAQLLKEMSHVLLGRHFAIPAVAGWPSWCLVAKPRSSMGIMGVLGWTNSSYHTKPFSAPNDRQIHHQISLSEHSRAHTRFQKRCIVGFHLSHCKTPVVSHPEGFQHQNEDHRNGTDSLQLKAHEERSRANRLLHQRRPLNQNPPRFQQN